MLEFFLFRLTEVRHDPIPNNLADHLSVLLAGQADHLGVLLAGQAVDLSVFLAGQADHLSVLLAEALPSKLKKERALHGIHDPPLQGKKLHLFTGSQSLITDAGLFLWAM